MDPRVKPEGVKIYTWVTRVIKSESDSTDKPGTVTVHKATQADVPTIAALAQQLAAYEGESSLCDAAAITALLKQQTEPVCYLVVAKVEIQVIGFAMYYPGYDLSSNSYGFHIGDIVIDAHWRRKGIGHELLSFIATQALKDERDWMSLTVLQNNEDAAQFYHSLGFQSVAVGFFAAGKSVLNQLASSQKS